MVSLCNASCAFATCASSIKPNPSRGGDGKLWVSSPGRSPGRRKDKTMHYLPSRQLALLSLVALGTACGVATQTQAQEIVKSPIVVAVESARPSVVAIRLPKANSTKKDISGTGIIIHSSGYLITNRHVVGAYKAVYVRLHDGKEYVANVVRADADADLALLHIQSNGAKFQAMALDPLEHLWVGEEVIAIGHPYGYAFTVSRG